MAENSKWDIVYQRLIAEGRESVDPPTTAEIEAFFSGALSDEDAGRIRERLVYYPEMVRVMTQPPPPEDVEVLTEAERADDWAAIQKAIAIPVPIRKPGPGLLLAYAAAATFAVAGIVFYVASRPATPSGASKPPLVAERGIEHRELQPDALLRGSEQPHAIVLAPAARYALKLLTIHDARYASYRIDVLDLGSNRVIWTRSDIPDSPDGAFEITLTGRQLRPGGHYRIALFGDAEQAATYTVRVTSRESQR